MNRQYYGGGAKPPAKKGGIGPFTCPTRVLDPMRTGGGGNSVRGFFRRGKFRMGKIPHLSQKIKGKILHLPNLQCIGSKRDPGIAIPKRSWEKAMTIVPEITSVDGVARHSQIIRLPAPPSLLVDNNCRIAGTKQLGARGEAQGIRWCGGLHGQIPHGENSAPPLEK